MEQTDLFGPGLPDGFRLWAHLIAPAEEQELVEQLKALPFQPFQFQGFEGKRRVVSFGWRYDFNGGGLQKSEDIPAFLQPLRARAARLARRAPESLQHVLLTEYAAGAGPRCVRRHHRRLAALRLHVQAAAAGRTPLAAGGHHAAAALGLRADRERALRLGAQHSSRPGTEILADLPQPQAAPGRRRARLTRMARLQMLPKTSPADARLSVRSA
jgi:hypothetical protein